MRATDMLMAFPTLLLALIIVTALGGTLFNEIMAIGIALTPNFVRLARSLTLTIRENDYIMAARAIGAGQLRVMAQHVFPNALYALVVVATLYIATAIRTEASLSFLGLGIPPPTPSWGNILSEGRQYIKCCPWITTFSGLAIMLAVLAFNMWATRCATCSTRGCAAIERRTVRMSEQHARKGSAVEGRRPREHEAGRAARLSPRGQATRTPTRRWRLVVPDGGDSVHDAWMDILISSFREVAHRLVGIDRACWLCSRCSWRPGAWRRWPAGSRSASSGPRTSTAGARASAWLPRSPARAFAGHPRS